MKQNFKLTKDQQTLVEKNLSIVHWVIVNNIHVNPGICGLEYGDLFQEGCLWLCKAAFTYNAGQAQFSTYAKKVVKNGLLSYCRKICSQGRHISRLIIGEQGELAADGEQVDQPDDHFDSHLSRLETLDLLEASKQNYQGVARLGIEALQCPLWIIAEDAATGRRLWITQEGTRFSISIRRMDEQGRNYGPTYRITCENRTKLAQVLRYQFESKTLAV